MPDPRDRPGEPGDETDVDAPPGAEEREQADALRAALEDPSRPSDDAELARALSSAWSPRDLPADAHRGLVEQALRRSDGRRRQRRSTVVRVSFGVTVLVAAAAAVLLLVRGPGPRPGMDARATTVAVSRSTQQLFPDPFAPTGGESARIDRIAVARAADLRDNEFARWGVR